MHFSDVWYASEARIQNRSTFLAYDDVGDLTFEGDRVLFVGRSSRLCLSNFTPPQLVGQSWNSVAYLAVNLALLPLFVGAYLAAKSLLGLNLLLPIVGATVASNALGYLVCRSTRWVMLSGKLESGAPARCYFADGSGRGWGGIFGGTQRILREARRLTSGCS